MNIHLLPTLKKVAEIKQFTVNLKVHSTPIRVLHVHESCKPPK